MPVGAFDWVRIQIVVINVFHNKHEISSLHVCGLFLLEMHIYLFDSRHINVKYSA